MPFINYKSDEGHADIRVAHKQKFGNGRNKKKILNSPLRLYFS